VTKPTGATQEQLEENNIEWVYCSEYAHRNVYEPMWALRHNSEYKWQEETTRLLQEIANLKRDCLHLAYSIDPFDTDIETYNILRKYNPDLPEKHPMDK
jgi:hypothetical protein